MGRVRVYPLVQVIETGNFEAWYFFDLAPAGLPYTSLVVEATHKKVEQLFPQKYGT